MSQLLKTKVHLLEKLRKRRFYLFFRYSLLDQESADVFKSLVLQFLRRRQPFILPHKEAAGKGEEKREGIEVLRISTQACHPDLLESVFRLDRVGEKDRTQLFLFHTQLFGHVRNIENLPHVGLPTVGVYLRLDYALFIKSLE